MKMRMTIAAQIATTSSINKKHNREQIMGAYDRFKEADPMGVRSWIVEGTHILLIKRTEMSQSKNPKTKGKEKAIIEFKTVKSDTVNAGKIMSLVEMETNQGYFGNVLAVTAGVLGYTIDDMKADEDFDAVFDGFWGSQQFCTDMLVRCIAQQTTTTKGGEYTAKTWEAIPASEYPEYNLIAPSGAYVPEERAAA